MNRRSIIAAVLLVVVAAGCGKSNEVGSGVDLNIKDQAAGARLGESTTTVAPAEDASGGDKAALGATTTAPPQTTTTAQAVTLTIGINSDDNASTQFDPSDARVYVGSLVEWVNRDTVPRSVVADNGAFDSGPIAPGATFRYNATATGQFSYTDGTRPYAVGTLEVIAR